MTIPHILEMENINKSFSRVPVLKNAHFELRKGEVHALMGGNGAGKSTLMKILTGVYTKDSGTILLEGSKVEFNKPKDAERSGIAMIFQEFSLIPTLTVAENIFLKHEPRRGLPFSIDGKEMVRRSREILNDLDVQIDPNATVDSLSVGYWQMVEIAKALSKNARILVMDEPTASLSESETRSLFQLVKRLKHAGISIVYISHRMAEIFEICDRITVMKDGQNVLTEECSRISMEQVIVSMLGKETASFEWQERQYELTPEPVVQVRNLAYGSRVRNVSFDLYPGEIVGLAGLMGSGRTEIAEAIFGIRQPEAGEILIRGKKIKNVRDAIGQGVALVPENRRKQGLILDHSVRSNVMLTNIYQLSKHLFVNDYAGTNMTNHYIQKLNIKTDGPDKIVKLLSGGNQQKIVLAKWLAKNPTLLILDEPTIGVDIGAKSEIVEIVRELADRGISVLVISSELQELLALSDRILVLYNGEIMKDIYRRDIETEEVLHHAIQGY
ncbi:sugar ABC transporter ATP-binding protein [Paenibacillus validus]|uniref:ATP-binding cassette domain-containing protein n=2 Tax=Paenibacillus TaxID=44249 RepID=A0A7X3CSB6_9BACL|nr:sugar ABC transporter ATP-binding protein [Paenibacillus validus]MED4599817.1 sugar ABC transporter ATP-binding protein [Paenibacillus validus]MED4604653.1 sugar ABC transporter ATP-binding protein [Paenibacillus validus]MUG70631.1 ATP-binding cassette domain-containing protein [Paenibacillus validus]